MKNESRIIEYKEIRNKSYLKTVSAFANYHDGEIIFGVTDDLMVVGINDPTNECLNIENQINDNIKPRPDYSLKVNKNGTISLFIKKGFNTPYEFEGKAYTRNDTSTVEVDSIMKKRLILEGMNLNYEEIPSNKSDLTFNFLSSKLIEKLNLSSFNNDILKSLNLYSDKNGYNNAANLLADNNDIFGLDIVVFGNSIDEFRRRYTFNNYSILKQYYDALNIFENEYVIEKIEGGFRKRYEIIPLQAFREAIANALIHRVWDIKVNIKVEMYKDKITIISPGGLASGINSEDFLRGSYSYLRNPIIAEVFHRLEIVEKFATGIRRINNSYKNSLLKPIFNITSGSISITLPSIDSMNLANNETKVYEAMRENHTYLRKELEIMTEYSKDTLIRILNSLIKKGLISKDGNSKDTKYYKKVFLYSE